MAMENSVCLLGGSQTFVGILATLVILCIAQNANNFMFEVLKDIKEEIVRYTKKLKPTISLDSIKESSDYKSLFLFTENKKQKGEEDEFCKVCKEAVAKIDIAKFSLQSKLTNWDKTVIDFADAIENKKEQQKGPMFAFAYCIVVFICDELLRCSYITFNQELLVVLSLFTGYVTIYWIVKWLVFMLRDDYTKQEVDASKSNIVKRSLRWVISLGNLIQFSLHLLLTFFFLYKLPEFVNTKEDVEDTILIFIGICYAPFLLFGLVHLFAQEKHSAEKETMHYVYHFFYMFLLSLAIMFFTEYRIPDLLKAFPLQDAKYLFYLKFTMIGTILCVGLICPFICTLIKYNMVYVRAFFKLLGVKIQKWKKESSLQNEFMELAQKIKV